MIRQLSFTDAVRREALAKSRLERVNQKLEAIGDNKSSTMKRELLSKRELLLKKKERLEVTLRDIQQMVAAHQTRTGKELPYVRHCQLKAEADAKEQLRVELEHLKATATELPEGGKVVNDSDAILQGVSQEALDAGLLQIQETLSGLLRGKPLVEVPSDVKRTPPKPKPKVSPVAAPMNKPTVAPALDLSGLDELLAECEALP